MTFKCHTRVVLVVFFVLISGGVELPRGLAEADSGADLRVLPEIIKAMEALRDKTERCKISAVFSEEQTPSTNPAAKPLSFEQRAEFLFFGTAIRVSISGGVVHTEDGKTFVKPTHFDVSFADGKCTVLNHKERVAIIDTELFSAAYGITDPLTYFAYWGKEPLCDFLRNSAAKNEIVRAQRDKSSGLLVVELRSSENPDSHHLLWFDETKGMLPVKQEIRVTPKNGPGYPAYEIHLSEVELRAPGFWCPKTAVMTSYEDEGKRLRFRRKCVITAITTDYRAKQEEFALPVALNYYIMDRIKGISFQPRDFSSAADVRLGRIAARSEALVQKKRENSSLQSEHGSGQEVGTASTTTTGASQSKPVPGTTGAMAGSYVLMIGILLAVAAGIVILLTLWKRRGPERRENP